VNEEAMTHWRAAAPKEEESKRKRDVLMSTVYRHCTIRCVLQLLATHCCLLITTSPNSVEKPQTALCLDASILASYSVLVFNSISQFKTKHVEGV
jgi:hypothetical protein